MLANFSFKSEADLSSYKKKINLSEESIIFKKLRHERLKMKSIHANNFCANLLYCLFVQEGDEICFNLI